MCVYENLKSMESLFLKSLLRWQRSFRMFKPTILYLSADTSLRRTESRGLVRWESN